MLKIVVFDGGYGGELFADQLEETFPVVEVIRVIDWRNADEFLKNKRSARREAIKALRPYIGRVDLIILANYYLGITSLKYLAHKFKNQKFVGLKLPEPDTFMRRPTAIFTTKALAKTISYRKYLFKLKRKTATLCLDHWLPLIDDGELTEQIIVGEFGHLCDKYRYRPAEIILACSHFNDLIPTLREKVDKNLKIHDDFRDTISEIGKTLKIRGGTGDRKH
ncbi:hypothetical protein IJG93_02615 [Candidatus Saccharibacteria bacterium]|nr:hypothetical protein [Candidatus Saccharibacteria bacterium]